jgi:hypothetical protein
MHAFWEDAAGGVLDPDFDTRRKVPVPLSRAAWVSAFSRR